MKKNGVIAMMCAILLSACGTMDRQAADDNTLYKKSGNTINQYEQHDQYNQSLNNDEPFGFVRQVKSPLEGETMDNQDIKGMNREQLAYTISKLTVALNHVVDSSVVVTDREVLIAYQTDDEEGKQVSKEEIADQVKKTAQSVVPRWFNVYVTDDPTLRQNVENIASMNLRMAEKNKTIADTVKLMLDRTPQETEQMNKTSVEK